MGRVYLEFKDYKWREVKQSDFWIDKYLLNKLKSLKRIQRKNWDGVIIVDGKERSGKSTLGMVVGWFMSNCKLTEYNFARGLDDCAKKIAELPDKSVIIVDEGSLIFSGKDSLNKQQKQLIKILDVVGQKNLIFIICLPCYFDLNKTIAVRRSLFLLHVYPDSEYDRGKYAYWGEDTKKKLFRIGKKNFDSYSYPRAEFVGHFPRFEPPFYQKYLTDVKAESLKEALGNAVSAMDIEEQKRLWEIDIIGRLNELSSKTTKVQMAEVFRMNRRTIHERIKAYKGQNKVITPIEYEVLKAEKRNLKIPIQLTN